GSIETGIDLPAVQMDEYATMLSVMNTLVAKGHRRLFFLEREYWTAGNADRRDAFVASLRHHGLAPSEEAADRCVVRAPLLEAPALTAIQKILRRRERTAIVCG